MRNYRGEIINGEVGDLVKGRCDFEKVARVVEIAKDGYGITIEETSYKLADDGFTVIREDTPSRLGETPRRYTTNSASILFLKEQREEE
jgi:hypothetical protein